MISVRHRHTKESFLVPLEVCQELSSCVSGAAKYALDRGKGLTLRDNRQPFERYSKTTAAFGLLSSASYLHVR